MSTSHLLYLHGFRSSPESTKARITAEVLGAHQPGLHWWCPQLPASPRLAADLIWQGVADWPRPSMAVMGSSLGGFYASWLAQRCACKAVLLNPAIDPARDLRDQVGMHPMWHDPNQRFEFKAEYLDELRDLQVGVMAQPQKILAIIAKGDELLDWREMSARYPGSPQKILPGSDHALSDYAQYLDEISTFLFEL